MKCCSARSVVGTSTATWVPSITALNAARTATSVLPNPDVATDQPVHRLGRSMSCLTSSIAPDLVGGLLERERILQLALPRRVRSERVSRHRHPNGVEPHELARHVANRALDLGRGARPIRAAHPVHARDARRPGISRPCRPRPTARRACRSARTPARGSRARRRRALGGPSPRSGRPRGSDARRSRPVPTPPRSNPSAAA